MIHRIVLAWVLLAVPASAQVANAPPATREAPSTPRVSPQSLPPPVDQIAARAEEVAGRLRRMTAAIGDRESFDRFERAVAETTGQVAQQWEATTRLLEGSPRRITLESSAATWGALRLQLRDLADEAALRAKHRGADLAALDGLHATWTSAVGLARSAAAPQAVVERAEATLSAIAATRVEVQGRRDHLLVLQDAISRSLQACDDASARIQDALAALLQRIFVRNESPVWEVRHLLADPTTGSPQTARLLEDLTSRSEGAVLYAKVYWVGLVLTAVVFLGLAAGLRRVSGGAGRSEATGSLHAPLAAAFLVTALVTRPLRPNLPAGVQELTLAFAVPAAVVVVRPMIGARLRALLYALAGLFALDLLRGLLEATPGLEQALLVFEMAVAAALVLRLAMRLPERPAPASGRRLWPYGLARAALRLVALMCAASAVAAALGYLEFADVIGGGGLFLMWSALALTAISVAAEAVVGIGLERGPLARLRAVARHRPRIERRIRRLLRLGLAGYWALAALGRFQLLDPARRAFRVVLDARLRVGELDLEVGRFVAFGLVVSIAWLVSRFVVFALEEDVYPRMALPRGVPYALSSLARHGVLLAGLFLALATLGLDLTRLTVLVSAFGLGIGFGLQQVVNNFVSGLVLLFERPIQVGDGVQLGELIGEVTRIGIRASTIRTLDGAEVIVPNSKLVEEQVTNWTLSDRKRRVDVEVGVAYGTDPEAVLALLVDVAKGEPGVAPVPAPEALFLGFGDSALQFQLRVWTEAPSWIRVQSRLGVAIAHRLRDAGIEVPFPQRDVWLRSPAKPPADESR
jgi:potassium-dependent mechanosensitive channel